MSSVISVNHAYLKQNKPTTIMVYMSLTDWGYTVLKFSVLINIITSVIAHMTMITNLIILLKTKSSHPPVSLHTNMISS